MLLSKIMVWSLWNENVSYRKRFFENKPHNFYGLGFSLWPISFSVRIGTYFLTLFEITLVKSSRIGLWW